MNLGRNEILLLFDVDGTLTLPRATIESDFEEFLYNKIRPIATIGLISGSDFIKLFEQLNGQKILKQFDFIFPENGLVQIVNGAEVVKQSIHKHLGEKTLQRFISFVLRYLAELELPFKRGTFIDFRKGMLNVCPIGRQCTRDERNFFADYDLKHNVRGTMIKKLQEEFHDIDLTYSVGGQISFNVFPHGWDKTYALKFVTNATNYTQIHFFGDQTEAGGNDYEIFNDPRTIGHKVSSPHDTKKILSELFQIVE